MNRDEGKDLLRRIDSYIAGLFVPPNPMLEGALLPAGQAGMPEIHVFPNEGELLQLLAEIMDVKRILEVGTLGGYSTIHLARDLSKDGSLVTLELY